jgi:alkylhydroperoxidase family enzyme
VLTGDINSCNDCVNNKNTTKGHIMKNISRLASSLTWYVSEFRYTLIALVAFVVVGAVVSTFLS